MNKLPDNYQPKPGDIFTTNDNQDYMVVVLVNDLVVRYVKRWTEHGLL